MTDDIVIRLKKDRDKDLFPILEEAAEEIERLREMVDTFYSLAQQFYEQVERHA